MQLARSRDDARVGGVDALDVGVDLAGIRAERGRDRGRGEIGAAAAEGRHLVGRRDALEPGHEHDLAVVERLVDAARAHLDDLRLPVHRVGDDPGLGAGERDRLVPEVEDRHRRERAGDALADRDEHVELARVRLVGDLARQVEELVRRVAHRGEDTDDAVAPLAGGDEPAGDALELLGVAHRGAAELHHDRAALGSTASASTVGTASNSVVVTCSSLDTAPGAAREKEHKKR